MTIDIKINLFIKRRNKYMQVLDFGDGGMKIFGEWHCVEGTAKSLSAKTKEELVLHMLQENEEMYFCSVNDIFAFKSKDVKMLSTGKSFFFVNDIRKELVTNGYREVEYKEVSNTVDTNKHKVGGKTCQNA